MSKINEFVNGKRGLGKICLKVYGSFILKLKIIIAYQFVFCIESGGREKKFRKGDAYQTLQSLKQEKNQHLVLTSIHLSHPEGHSTAACV